jgi:hypothetical protein
MVAPFALVLLTGGNASVHCRTLRLCDHNRAHFHRCGQRERSYEQGNFGHLKFLRCFDVESKSQYKGR